MPLRGKAENTSKFNASPECWAVYGEVLAAEYSNAVLFGQIHQLTVDTYAVQHPGGKHGDKSICVHLCGLHLVIDHGVRPPLVPPLLQRVAAQMPSWPHYPPPDMWCPLTAFDVALSSSMEEHIVTVWAWARQVWAAWSPFHRDIAAIVTAHHGPEVGAP